MCQKRNLNRLEIEFDDGRRLRSRLLYEFHSLALLFLFFFFFRFLLTQIPPLSTITTTTLVGYKEKKKKKRRGVLANTLTADGDGTFLMMTKREVKEKEKIPPLHLMEPRRRGQMRKEDRSRESETGEVTKGRKKKKKKRMR